MAEFPYCANAASVRKLMDNIQVGAVPRRVGPKYMEGLGLSGSDGRALMSILKALGFLSAAGVPAERWRTYRDRASAPRVMAEALHETYANVFEAYPDAHRREDNVLISFFGTEADVAHSTLVYMVRTFRTLCSLADFESADFEPTKVWIQLPDGTSMQAEIQPQHSPADVIQGLQERGNLPPSGTYDLALLLDGHARLSHPVQLTRGTKLVLWTASHAQAQRSSELGVRSVFKGRGFTVENDLCFVLMPFGPKDLQEVYGVFVKPTVEKCGFQCQRADDIYGVNAIIEDVWATINRAGVIIAELTGRNPNVFYEVGICHTLGKDVILLTQDIEDVPFDLRYWRVLVYNYTPPGCKRLEEELAKHLHATKKPR